MTRKNIPLCPKESAASRTRTAPAAARRHPPTHFSRLESLRYPLPITAMARNAVKWIQRWQKTHRLFQNGKGCRHKHNKRRKTSEGSQPVPFDTHPGKQDSVNGKNDKNKIHKVQFPEMPFHTELQEPSSRTPNTAAPPKRRSASAAAPQEESILPAIQVSAAARAKTSSAIKGWTRSSK